MPGSGTWPRASLARLGRAPTDYAGLGQRNQADGHTRRGDWGSRTLTNMSQARPPAAVRRPAGSPGCRAPGMQRCWRQPRRCRPARRGLRARGGARAWTRRVAPTWLCGLAAASRRCCASASSRPARRRGGTGPDCDARPATAACSGPPPSTGQTCTASSFKVLHADEALGEGHGDTLRAVETANLPGSGAARIPTRPGAASGWRRRPCQSAG